MKKRNYRAKTVNQIRQDTVAKGIEGQRVVLGIDVAKEICFGRLVDERRQVLATVKWHQLKETRQLIQWLGELDGSGVEVVMEPSGSYGDPLRYQLRQAGFPVYRVSGKRCHDAAEVYDGVPSMHDAKAADIIARLHLEGASRLWDEKDGPTRELAAEVEVMTIHDEAYHRTANRIEAKLARHWPELTTILDLGSATLLALLEKYGGPRAVQEDPAGVRVHLRQAGRQFWSADKIEQVIASATTTLGMPMMAAEEKALRTLAEEANRQRKAKKAAERDVARCAQAKPVVQHMASTVGTATATVLVTTVGAPEDYPNAHSYLKAFGLNLKERSSGKCQGQLKITKRGPAQARRYLYLAALRLIQKKRGDKVVRAWYLRKVMRDGGRYKKKAVVALMRKLALALWHVGQGEVFDSHRLFDARRLKTAEQIALAA